MSCDQQHGRARLQRQLWGLTVDAPRSRHELAFMRRLRSGLASGILMCLVAFLCSSCGGTDRRHPVNSAASRTAAPFIAMRSDASASTVHFPRGLYSLDAEDQNGYYYR